jgi:tetratricopeptide (TPR) repeat protein
VVAGTSREPDLVTRVRDAAVQQNMPEMTTCPPAPARRTILFAAAAAACAVLLSLRAGSLEACCPPPSPNDEDDSAEETSGEEAEAEGKSKEELKREKTAEIHFDRGVDFFRDGMIAAALAEFLKSYKASPHWAVLYNVGVCYYRLGRYDESIQTFERYVEEGGEEIPPERRFTVEKMKIKMAASYGSIAVECDTPGVRVTIDGSHTFQTPLEEPIPIAAGIHSIFIYHYGHYPILEEITVASGEESVVPVKLEMTPLMETLLSKTGSLEYLARTKEIKKMEKATHALLGTSSAAGLGMIAAGILTYSYKQKQHDEMILCRNPTSRDTCPDGYDYKDKADTWKWVTVGFAAGTGALLLAALTLWLVKGSKENVLMEESSPEITLGRRVRLGWTDPAVLSLTW